MPEPICPSCCTELEFRGETVKQNFRLYWCRSCNSSMVMQAVKCQNWLGNHGGKAASPFTTKNKSGFLIHQKQ